MATASDANLEAVLTIRDLATAAITKFEKTTGRAAKRSEKAFGGAEKAVDRLKRSVLQLGGALAAVFAARKIGTSLISFEQNLVGVGKTAGIQGKALEALGEDFIFLSRKIPVPANELLKIGRVAGQLGVRGSANIIKFTESIARLSAASEDFQGEEAALTLSRTLTVTREAQGDIDRLASVVAQLGDTSKATEREIAVIGLQVAKAGSVFGLSAASAMGLAAAYKTTGAEAELAATSTLKSMSAIDQAIRRGGEAARIMTNLTGKSIDELATIFRKDAALGFHLFVEGLGKVIDAGGDARAVLESLELADQRLAKTILPLARSSDLIAEKVAEGNKEWRENQKLIAESERAWATLGNAIVRMGNTLTAAILGLDSTTDSMSTMTGSVTAFIEQFFGMEKRVEKTTPAIVRFTAVVKIGASVLLGLATPKILAFFAALGKAIWGATSALIGMNTAANVNPFVRIASAALTAATMIGLFSLGTSEAQKELDSLGQTSKRVAESLQRAAAAAAIEDLAAQSQHLQSAIEGIKKARIDLKLLSDRGEKITFGRLIGIDPSIAKSREFLEMVGKVGRELERMASGRGQRIGGAAPGMAAEIAKTRAIEYGKSVVILNGILKKHGTTLGEVAKKLRDLGEAGKDGFDRTIPPAEKATKAIDKLQAALNLERLALQVGAKDQDAANVVRAVGANLINLEAAAIVALLPKLAGLFQALKAIRQVREQQKATKDLQTFLGQLDMERQLLGKSSEEAWVLTTTMKGLQLAQAANIPVTEELRSVWEEYVKTLGKAKFAQDSLEEGFAAGFGGVTAQFDTAAKRMTIAGADTANALLDAFTIDFFDPMTGKFHDLGEIGRSVINSLLSAFSQIGSRFLAMTALGQLGINTTGLAKGGAMDNGRLIPAQKGLIMSQPTILGLGGGRGVLAAERHRKEAVMPLTTTSSGDLGVHAVGGDGGSVLTINQTIQVQNAGSDPEMQALKGVLGGFEKTLDNWFVSRMATGSGGVRRSVVRTVKTA